MLSEDGGGCKGEEEEIVEGLLNIIPNATVMLHARLPPFLTGEWSAGGGVEAVAAVSAVAAGDVIVRVFGCRERRAVVHLFISSFEAEGRPCLHGNSVSEGREQQASGLRRLRGQQRTV